MGVQGRVARWTLAPLSYGQSIACPYSQCVRLPLAAEPTGAILQPGEATHLQETHKARPSTAITGHAASPGPAFQAAVATPGGVHPIIDGIRPDICVDLEGDRSHD